MHYSISNKPLRKHTPLISDKVGILPCDLLIQQDKLNLMDAIIYSYARISFDNIFVRRKKTEDRNPKLHSATANYLPYLNLELNCSKNLLYISYPNIGMI
jgi:hypothetical protein